MRSGRGHAGPASGRRTDRRRRALRPPARTPGGDGDLDRRRRARSIPDSVVPIEQVVVADNAVEINASRARRERAARGWRRSCRRCVARRGHPARRRPGCALAAVGLSSVSCARRPRVAVLSTGTELRRPASSSARSDLRVERADARRGLRHRGRAGRVDRAGRRRRRSPRRALERGLEADSSSARAASRWGARPRAPGARRARRRGGLLGRRGQAGQAAGLRRPRADACLRALEPGLGARRVRAFVRPALLALRVRPGPARSTSTAASRRPCAAMSGVTTSPGRLRPDADGSGARAGHRPGVSHDRPGGRRGRARPRAARRRRPAPRFATSVSSFPARRPAEVRAAVTPEDGKRAARTAPADVRVRRVSAGRQCRQLRCDREPDDADPDGDPGRTRRRRARQVPRRVQAEVEARRERHDQENRPGQPEHEQRGTRERACPCTCGSHNQA